MTAIALHAADAAAHDHHAGRAGSFVEALAALDAARARGEALEVATDLTRSNARILAALPPLLHARGVARWSLHVATYAAHAEHLVPRLALALPFALHAADRAARLGLATAIAGAPLCLLGPFADRAVPVAPRAFAPACETCALRPRCPGVDATYLARFGPGELTAR